VLKTMQCVLAGAALALTLGVTAVSAQQDNSGSSSGTSSGSSMTGGAGMTGGSDMSAGMTSHTDWSRRYILTPMEYRRLRALGLNDEEVFAAANVAEKTGIQLDGPNFDDPVQMLQRGATMWEIAQKYNVPQSTLQSRRPEWESADWRQNDTGFWYAHSTGMTGTTTGGDQYRTTTTRSRRTRTERDRTTTDTTTTPSTGTDTNPSK
jgi:hypothetical protein